MKASLCFVEERNDGTWVLGQITTKVNGVSITRYLGTYTTREEAVAASVATEKELNRPRPLPNRRGLVAHTRAKL